MHARPRAVTVRAAAVAVALAVALAGCTAAGASSSAGGSGGERAASIGDAAGETPGSAAGTTGQSADTDRSVVTTGSLSLTATDPLALGRAISAITTDAGGRVQSMTESPSGRASAQLTLRIPASAFDRALTRIKAAGAKVTDLQVGTTDVTSTVTDAAVRISVLRTSITRLEQLLARASSTDDLVAIEKTLTSRQTSLDELLSDQKDLADQVAYATLTVSISAPPVAHRPAPTTFTTGVAAGWTSFTATVAALVVGLGIALPWLAAVGLLSLAAFGARRLMRRRRASVTAP